MRLILIRHTSVAVPKGVCYGQTDVPLNGTFEQEAGVVKEKIKGIHFDHVYTSPLSRCSRLAEYCGYPEAESDSRLMEMNFGDWEMKRYDEIDDPRLQEWYDDFMNVKATGGESSMQQCKRFMDFVEDIRHLHRAGTTIGIFTHGGILTHALARYGGYTYEEAFGLNLPYGAIVEIEL